jgi:hypothetical protein
VDDDPAALLSAGTLRALVVLALFAAGLCAVVVAAAATILDLPGTDGGLVLAAALLALAATPGACWAFEQGHWSWNGAVATFQVACAALLATAHLAGCLFCASRAADAISARGPYGATVLEVVAWLAVTAGGLLLLALLLASVPMPPSARLQLRWLLAAVATVAAAVAFMAGGTQVLAGDCDAFAFETGGWRAALAGEAGDRDVERLFAAVARCGTVDGMARDEVVATLGRPSSRTGGEWTWTGPEVNGLFATAPVLDVTFADGHVVAVAADGGGD